MLRAMRFASAVTVCHVDSLPRLTYRLTLDSFESAPI